MSRTMRAITYDGVGGLPRLTEMAVPECPPDGALVRVEATGVCRSDWHAWRGDDPVPLPVVPGHEFAGVVVEVGDEVRRFRPGNRVTSPSIMGCGHCPWCLRGQSQVCPDQSRPGFTRPGSFAEDVLVTAADTNLVMLPAEVGFDEAAVLGCRFATAFRAVTMHGGVGEGDEVAVFGCGGVGLSAVMIAAARGARVTAVDVSDAALRRALELGASQLVRSSSPEATAAAVTVATGGGATVTIDAFGSAATAWAAVNGLQRRGRHVQVGLMLGRSATAPLPWERVMSWELTVTGSHGMSAADYPAMLAMITDGALAPRRLIGARTDLAGAIDALVTMGAHRSAPGITVVRP